MRSSSRLKGTCMIACGLDFGTSNSAIGVAQERTAALAPIEDGRTLMPSAVFFDDTLVLDGHLVARERHEPGPEGEVLVVERRSQHGIEGLRGAFPGDAGPRS